MHAANIEGQGRSDSNSGIQSSKSRLEIPCAGSLYTLPFPSHLQPFNNGDFPCQARLREVLGLRAFRVAVDEHGTQT